MLLVPALLLCLLAATGVASQHTEVSMAGLVSKIGNRHILRERENATLLNVPNGRIIIELFPRDCREAYLRGHRFSGLYIIHPKNGFPLLVYCDFLTEGGGWTVLLRNNRKERFVWFHKWDTYKFGFGNPMGNHRVGNEFIYLLTRQNAYSVRFLIVDSKGRTRYADYQSFRVDSERNRYALRLGDYSGDAGDALSVIKEPGVHDNMKFTTSDWDNDRWRHNCAVENKGGWWYDSCQSALLSSDLGIYWEGLCDRSNPCRSATIMIKPNNKNCVAGKFPETGDIPIHMPSK